MKCDHPFWVFSASPGAHYSTNPDELWKLGRVPVPCGRCPNCRKRRVDDWVFRIQQEERGALSSYFITLTYDGNTVPLAQGSGRMTLNPDDLTNFFKRLRYYEERQFNRKKYPHLYYQAGTTINKKGKSVPKYKQVHPIKYYACGEYGTNRWRPHYHVIILNVKDTKNITKAWTLGGIDSRSCSGNAIAYTTGYVNKLKRVPAYPGDDRHPEISRMSKGLGEPYLTDVVKKYHTEDLSRLYCTKLDGSKIAMPRYYRKKLFNGGQRLAQLRIIQDEVKIQEEKAYKDFRDMYGDEADYEAYKQSCVNGRYRRFYSKIASKQRDKP